MKIISIFLIQITALCCINAYEENLQLSELIVQADSEPSLTVPSTAASLKELAKTPGGVEVVDAERILKGRASTLVDTFALSPGVFAQSRFGSDEARLSIRGSGMQRTFHGRGIRVLQDGIPINLADGSFDMQSLEPTATSHINVWRGANALAYGSSTLGGAIDYISRDGRNSPGGFFRVEAGSWNYLRATAAAGISNDQQDAYLSFTQQMQSGFRDHAEQNNQRLFANFGWKISEHIENRTYLTSIFTDSELPGSLTKAELESNPRQADRSFFGSLQYDNKRDFELFRIANKTTIDVNVHRLEFVAGYTYKDLDHPITPFVGVIDQLSNDILLGTSYLHKDEFYGYDHFFRAGMTYHRGITNNVTFANLLGGNRGAMQGTSEQTAENIELFIEEQLEIGAGFTGILGLTSAYTNRDNDVLFGPVASYDRSFTNISPKIGLRHDRSDYQIYANVSGSYEPPSFSEAITTTAANHEQRATTFEIGTRGKHGFVGWDASIYHANVKDEFLALNDNTGTPLGTVNADRTIHQGVELGIEVDFLGNDLSSAVAHRIMFRSAWNYGRFTFDDDDVYGDNRIAGLPPHLIRGELLWENDYGCYVGPTFEWVPEKTYIDHANSFSANPYSLFGFKIGLRKPEGLSWFIEAKNLMDETYVATTGVIADSLGSDSRNFLPGDGRSFFIGAEWSW